MISRYKRVGNQGRLEHRVVIEEHFGRSLHKDELVHHINGDRFDNRLSNLVVMSAQAHSYLHNNIHGRTKECGICGSYYTPQKTKRSRSKTCSLRCLSSLTKINAEKRKIPIIQLSVEGHFIKQWDSARDVQSSLGFYESNINKCCNNKSETAYGFKWKYL